MVSSLDVSENARLKHPELSTDHSVARRLSPNYVNIQHWRKRSWFMLEGKGIRHSRTHCRRRFLPVPFVVFEEIVHVGKNIKDGRRRIRLQNQKDVHE